MASSASLRTRVFFRGAMVAVGLTLAFVTTAPAKDGVVAAEGQYALAGSASQTLTAITVTYGPGARSPPHRHDAAAFVYVLSGSVRSQVEGGKVQIFAPGESWFEPVGAHHVVSENASASRPASILVVFVGGKDAKLSIVDGR